MRGFLFMYQENLPVSVRSVTPSREETYAILPRPDGDHIVRVVVLAGPPPLPFTCCIPCVDLCSFVSDIVDEKVELPIAIARDQAEAKVGNRIGGQDVLRINRRVQVRWRDNT